MRLRVLYWTVPSYFDMEISLIRELSRFCDVTVLLNVTPTGNRLAGFSMSLDGKKPGIYRADSLPDMARYSGLVDLSRWHIVLNADGSPLTAARLARSCRRMIARGGYDIFHGTTVGSKIDLFMLGFIRRRRGTLLTVHDYVPHSREGRVASMLRRAAIKSYGNIVMMSHSQYELARADTRPAYSRLFESRLGTYDYLSSFGAAPRQGRYILFFGRIDAYKDMDLLIEAYSGSSLPAHGVELVIAGKGGKGYRGRGITHIDRYIESPELASLIAGCECVVLPYRSVTQSGALMSAYALGKPVIAPATGSFTQLIDDGATGMLYTPSDALSLRRCMETMTTAATDSFSAAIHDAYGPDSRNGWREIARGLYDIYTEISAEH